ncbi:MAG: response regulator [Chloroflexota bacterium]|nr:response regulator [Chloroflexota bacterium]
MSDGCESVCRTVLVAEDAEVTCHLITKGLERLGLKVVCVASGAGAIDFISTNPDIVLLLDYQLPDMTGKQVVEILNERQIKVPFLVMTGHDDAHLAEEMIGLGASACLVKNSQFRDLLPQVMCRILERAGMGPEYAEVEKDCDSARKASLR